MKIILWIWLAITLTDLLFAVIGGFEGGRKFKELYPQVCLRRHSIIEAFGAFFRLVIMCAIPIFHLLVFIGIIFMWDTFIQYVIKGIEKEVENENNA